MPRGSAPTPSNAPLFPAFPLYAVTPISSNTSLSAFNVGPSPNFPATHVIMTSSIVNLTVDLAQALLVNMLGRAL